MSSVWKEIDLEIASIQMPENQSRMVSRFILTCLRIYLAWLADVSCPCGTESNQAVISLHAWHIRALVIELLECTLVG